MKSQTITMNDGRTVGFADYGSPAEVASTIVSPTEMDGGTFDVTRITCPVVVLHGAGDGLMPVANAHHTAAIVPGATLRILDGVGHISILTTAVDILSEQLIPAASAALGSRS